MLIFKTMCDNPAKFASEKDECNIKAEDYIGIYDIFKKVKFSRFHNCNYSTSLKYAVL